MRWYGISRYAASGIDPDEVYGVAQLYQGQQEVDPQLAATAILTMKRLTESGQMGSWNIQTIGEVMGLLDRLGIDYSPPQQQEWASPQEAYEALSDIPEEQQDMPPQAAPQIEQQRAEPRRRAPWRTRLRRRKRRMA